MINKAKSFDRHSLMQGQVEVKKPENHFTLLSPNQIIFDGFSLSYFLFFIQTRTKKPAPHDVPRHFLS